MNTVIHPFDLHQDHLAQHKRGVYRRANKSVRQAFSTPKATIEKVLLNLAAKISLKKETWRTIMRQFDASCFDVNIGTKEANIHDSIQRIQSIDRADILKMGPTSQLPESLKRDLILLANKIEFQDFLKAVQREAEIRDVLSEHQLYFHSTFRFKYQKETKLVMKSTLEQMSRSERGEKIVKAPEVTYLIDRVCVFDFQGMLMALIAFENKTVSTFKMTNGHFDFEFKFENYALEQEQNQNHTKTEKELEQERLEEMELERQGFNGLEIKAIQRQRKRERGEIFLPAVPAFTPVKKSEYQVKIARMQTIKREKFFKRMGMASSRSGMQEIEEDYDEEGVSSVVPSSLRDEIHHLVTGINSPVSNQQFYTPDLVDKVGKQNSPIQPKGRDVPRTRTSKQGFGHFLTINQSENKDLAPQKSMNYVPVHQFTAFANKLTGFNLTNPKLLTTKSNFKRQPTIISESLQSGSSNSSSELLDKQPTVMNIEAIDGQTLGLGDIQETRKPKFGSSSLSDEQLVSKTKVSSSSVRRLMKPKKQEPDNLHRSVSRASRLNLADKAKQEKDKQMKKVQHAVRDKASPKRKDSVKKQQRISTGLFLQQIKLGMNRQLGSFIEHQQNDFIKEKKIKFEQEEESKFQKLQANFNLKAVEEAQEKKKYEAFQEKQKQDSASKSGLTWRELALKSTLVKKGTIVGSEQHFKRMQTARKNLSVDTNPLATVQVEKMDTSIGPRSDMISSVSARAPVSSAPLSDQAKKKEAKAKREEKKAIIRSRMYGVLGLDPLVDSEELQKQKQDEEGIPERFRGHPYGLEDNMFTSSQMKKEQEDSYHRMMKNLDFQIKVNSKKLELKKGVDDKKKPSAKKQSMQSIRDFLFRNSAIEKTKQEKKALDEEAKKFLNDPVAMQEYVQNNRQRKSMAENKMQLIKHKQKVLKQWMDEVASKQDNPLLGNFTHKKFDTLEVYSKDEQPLNSDRRNIDTMKTQRTTHPDAPIITQVTYSKRSQEKSPDKTPISGRSPGKKSASMTPASATPGTGSKRRGLSMTKSMASPKMKKNASVDRRTHRGSVLGSVKSKNRMKEQFGEINLKLTEKIKASFASALEKRKVSDKSGVPDEHQIKKLLEKERAERSKQNESKVAMQIDELNPKKRFHKRRKKTYPLTFLYYEPHDIAIFALVSREIQIHKHKQMGVRRSFFHIQSLRVENVVLKMTIGQQRGTKHVVLAIATQSSRTSCSEVVVFVMHPDYDFEVLSTFRWALQQEYVSGIHYNENCGLIIATNNGTMEIYDAVKINECIWDNLALKKKPKITANQSRAISQIDYSELLDIIVYAGIAGSIFVLDQTTKNLNGVIDAHSAEIVLLKLYDAQYQLVSVSKTGEVGLWDSQKLTKIMVVRLSENLSHKFITSCSFHLESCLLFLTTTRVFKFRLQVDSGVQVLCDQQNAIARDYLREFFNQLKQAGVIKLGTEEEEGKTASLSLIDDQSSKLSVPKSQAQKFVHRFDTGFTFQKRTEASSRKDSPRGKKSRIKDMTVSQYMQTGYNDDSIKDHMKPEVEFNGSVLPGSATKLASVIFDQTDFLLYTLDLDLLIRAWDLKRGSCLRSYKMETRQDQIEKQNSIGGGGSNNLDEYGNRIVRKKATLARSTEDRKFLVIALEDGEIQVNNLFTGQLIYNNFTVEPVTLDQEVTRFKFFKTSTQFWFVASCWEGKVAFITRPQTKQGRNFLSYKSKKCSHEKDVVALDINAENQIVTGSIDNVICFWNSFSGIEQKHIRLPFQIANQARGEYVHYIRYPFPNKREYLFIVLNTGDCFVLDTSSEKFILMNPKTPPKGTDRKRRIDILKEESRSDSDESEMSQLKVQVIKQSKHQPTKSIVIPEQNKRFTFGSQVRKQIFQKKKVLSIFQEAKPNHFNSGLSPDTVHKAIAFRGADAVDRLSSASRSSLKRTTLERDRSTASFASVSHRKSGITSSKAYRNRLTKPSLAKSKRGSSSRVESKRDAPTSPWPDSAIMQISGVSPTSKFGDSQILPPGSLYGEDFSKMADSRKNLPWLLGTIAKNPVLALHKAHIVSISEHGHGLVHTLTFKRLIGRQIHVTTGLMDLLDAQEHNEELSPTTKILGLHKMDTPSNQPPPIHLDQIGSFEVPNPELQNNPFQVVISGQNSLFFVAQARGQVSFFTLPGCEPLGQLNSSTFSLELHLLCRSEGSESSSKSRIIEAFKTGGKKHIQINAFSEILDKQVGSRMGDVSHITENPYGASVSSHRNYGLPEDSILSTRKRNVEINESLSGSFGSFGKPIQQQSKDTKHTAHTNHNHQSSLLTTRRTLAVDSLQPMTHHHKSQIALMKQGGSEHNLLDFKPTFGSKRDNSTHRISLVSLSKDIPITALDETQQTQQPPMEKQKSKGLLGSFQVKKSPLATTAGGSSKKHQANKKITAFFEDLE